MSTSSEGEPSVVAIMFRTRSLRRPARLPAAPGTTLRLVGAVTRPTAISVPRSPPAAAKPARVAGTRHLGRPVPPETPRLSAAQWVKGRSSVVSIAGDLDATTAAQLSHVLRAALRRSTHGLVCDLTRVDFLDASGLTSLLLARRAALAHHTWFDLVCPRPAPRNVIRLTGLDTVFALHDRVSEAVDVQQRRTSPPGRERAPVSPPAMDSPRTTKFPGHACPD